MEKGGKGEGRTERDSRSTQMVKLCLTVARGDASTHVYNIMYVCLQSMECFPSQCKEHMQ